MNLTSPANRAVILVSSGEAHDGRSRRSTIVARRLRPSELSTRRFLTTGGAVGRQFLAMAIEDYLELLDWTARGRPLLVRLGHRHRDLVRVSERLWAIVLQRYRSSRVRRLDALSSNASTEGFDVA